MSETETYSDEQRGREGGSGLGIEERTPLWEIGQLHSTTRGEPGIRVAVLDGPVDISHASFRNSSLTVLGDPGRSTSDGSAAMHGTHVASVILGRDGIAPGCTGLVIPIYEDDEGQVRPASQETLARAIDRAIDQGAHVINVSGGQLEPSGRARSELQEAVERCCRRNVLLIAAAGNDGCACLHVPGALPSVLAVAAADDQGRPLPSSNWSGPYQEQGILAPGQHIPGALPAGGGGEASGSSYATAVSSGVAALLLSAQAATGAPVDPSGVRRAILSSVSRCDPSVTVDCHRHLVGHLNPLAAMSLITQGANPMSEGSFQNQNPSAAAVEAAAPGAGSSPADAQPQGLDGAIGSAGASAAVPAASVADIGPAEGVLPMSSSEPSPGSQTSASRPIEGLPATSRGGVEPSDCGCGGDAQGVAYVLGQIDYDFGTLENFDWFKQNAKIGRHFINPNDPTQLLKYLEKNPEFASALIWTIEIAGVPIYALDPEDCYCEAVYDRIREYLAAQLAVEEENRGQHSITSIPARVKGTRRLLSGAIVPQLVPDLRGMFNFTPEELVKNAKALLGLAAPPSESQKSFLNDFLKYVVDKERNLGRSPADRAINYVAVQGLLGLFGGKSIPSDFRLSSIDSTLSPFCPPGGECQDTTLTLFNPDDAVNTAPLVYRQTVDVATVNPVLVGAAAVFRVR